MRVLIPAILLGLAACANEVPNSARPQGVGFGNYSSYAAESARREAMLAGRAIPSDRLVPSEPVISTERVAAAQPQVTVPPLPATGAAIDSAPLAGGGTVAVVAANNPSLSDEQSFEAVSGRETIESDAERLARQRAAYEVVQPAGLPERPKDSGPNIVAYALSTTNAVGQPLYRRSPVNAQARYARACAQYSSSDQAQAAFLEMGGPENDRKGMDPDGDGFACTWDPSPFRTARN